MDGPVTYSEWLHKHRSDHSVTRPDFSKLLYNRPVAVIDLKSMKVAWKVDDKAAFFEMAQSLSR